MGREGMVPVKDGDKTLPFTRHEVVELCPLGMVFDQHADEFFLVFGQDELVKDFFVEGDIGDLRDGCGVEFFVLEGEDGDFVCAEEKVLVC
jgi:hypothetical protein